MLPAEEKYNLASTELGETGEKYEGIKEEYERIQQEIESLDTAIEAAREQLTDTGLMRGKLEGEINVLKEQINSAHGSENHLTTVGSPGRGDCRQRAGKAGYLNR